MRHRYFPLVLAIALAGPWAASACQSTSPAASVIAPSPSASSWPEWTGYQSPKITPQDYLQRKASGENFLILDARPAAPYNAEHIAGAIDVPESDLAAIAPTLPRDRPLLVYCTCSDEGLSLTVAGMLHDQYGFTNLQVILGGLGAWKAAGLPTQGTSVTPSAAPSAAP